MAIPALNRSGDRAGGLKNSQVVNIVTANVTPLLRRPGGVTPIVCQTSDRLDTWTLPCLAHALAYSCEYGHVPTYSYGSLR